MLAARGKPSLDGIVNFAGIMSGGPLCGLDEEDFTRIMDTNITG